MRTIPLIGAGALALLLLGPARADIIHLTTGRSVSGTIVKEDDQQVVVRTPEGKLTLPRNLVASIERQSKGETQLALAREHARAGDWDGARRLLEEATKDADPDLAARARSELEALTAAEARSKKLEPKPRDPLPLPEGTTGAPIAGSSLQSQFDRARRALEDRDHILATRLLRALVEGNPKDRVLRYLLGRAHELAGREQEAGAEYALVLGELSRAGRAAAHQGELARRLLAREELGADSPGLAAGWQRVATPRHFALYHSFEKVEPWLVDELEQALEEVTTKLSVQIHELRFAGRIQVFMFPDKAAYEASTGMKLAGGHAAWSLAPDGGLWRIAAYPNRAFYRTTLRHEVAHVILGEIFPGLQAWAQEGAATWCEPLETRGRLRVVAQGRIQARQQPPLFDLLSDKVPRGEDKEAVRAYYALANVAFDALTERSGSARKALKICQRIAREGPELGLRTEGISPRDLEADMARLAAQSTSTE